MNVITFKSETHSSADPNTSSYIMYMDTDWSVTYKIVLAEDYLFSSIKDELQITPLAEIAEPPPNQMTPYDDDDKKDTGTKKPNTNRSSINVTLMPHPTIGM